MPSWTRVNSGPIGYDIGLAGTPLLSVVTTCCAMGFLLVGYDNGVLGGIINTPAFRRTFDEPSPGTIGNIVSLYEIGCFIGAMSTFSVGEALGRRHTVMLGSVWMLVGAIIQSACGSVAVMILGRIICGIGMGLINATVPVYQAEMSPAVSRGQLVAVDLSILNCGIVLSYWVCYGFNFSGLTGNTTWRIPIAIQCFFIIAICLIAAILPDTPRWYAMRNRNTEALTVLARLRGRSETECAVQEEFNDIQATILHEAMAKKSGWWSLIKPSEGWGDDVLRSRRRLLLACFIQAAQQLGGINALIYYSATLFSQSLNFGDRDSALLAGGLNMVLILGSLLSIFLVDRIGRRKLLLPCIAAMSFVFVLQTIFVKKIQEGTAVTGIKNAAVAMLFLFDAAFSLGFQATVWMIPSEILPLNIRTQGSALSTASNWICNFIVVKCTPSALANIGYRTYIIFAVFNACWLPVIYFFLPETAGLVLEEIDALFAKDGWHLEHKLVAGGLVDEGRPNSTTGEAIQTKEAMEQSVKNVEEDGKAHDSIV